MRNRKSSNGQLKILLFVGAIFLALALTVFGLSKIKVDEFAVRDDDHFRDQKRRKHRQSDGKTQPVLYRIMEF